MSSLTTRKRRFLVEYLKDFDAKRAALKAGYSKTTAERSQARLLRDIDVQGELDLRLEQSRNVAKARIGEIIEDIADAAVGHDLDGVRIAPALNHQVTAARFLAEISGLMGPTNSPLNAPNGPSFTFNLSSYFAMMQNSGEQIPQAAQKTAQIAPEAYRVD